MRRAGRGYLLATCIDHLEGACGNRVGGREVDSCRSGQ